MQNPQDLSVGFSRLDVTPPLGIGIPGYFEHRVAETILDPIQVTAVAIQDAEKRQAVLLTLDVIGIDIEDADNFVKHIAAENNLDESAIFLACTHTHTGPSISLSRFKPIPAYNEFLMYKLADATKLALADCKPATLSCGHRELKDFTFVRRYKMRDGHVQTWAKYMDPELVAPADEADETVQLIRFSRDAAPDILLVNFQTHPDLVSGTGLSADFPKYVCETLELALPGIKCAYFNGAQGDLTPFNVWQPAEKAMKKSIASATHVGRAIAGTALQIYGNMQPVEATKIGFSREWIKCEMQKDNSRLEEAENIIRLSKTGEIKSLNLGHLETPTLAEAYRLKRLANKPSAMDLPVSVIQAGMLAFVGLPGEPFNALGRRIKASSPFDMTFVCCVTHGGGGYFPTAEAYVEGGYEPYNSNFRAGVGEKLVEQALETLKKLHTTY
jgi:neutral ceramidase